MELKYFSPIITVTICLVMAGSAGGWTNTNGGVFVDTKVQKTFFLLQDEFPDPSDPAVLLKFKVWQKEDNISINGWYIDISHFMDSDSHYGDQPEPWHSTFDIIDGEPWIIGLADSGLHAVDVSAEDAEIPYGTTVQVDVDFYLTSWNTVRLADVYWGSWGTILEKGAPDQGWTLGFPEADPAGSGFIHKLTITNDDKTEAFTVTNLTILPLRVDYEDLTLVPFATHPDAFKVPDKLLNPGESYVIDVRTPNNYIGSHIYHTYGIADPTGAVDMLTLSDHPVVPPCLYVEPTHINAKTGGASGFILSAGAANANRDYILLGGLSGTTPGTPLPGGYVTLPLNMDVFTDIVLQLINTPVFSNFMGKLDANGRSYAVLDSMGPLPAQMVGLVMYFAYALNNPWNYVSTPVVVQIL